MVPAKEPERQAVLAWESVAQGAEGRVRALVLVLVEQAQARVLAQETEERVRVQALVLAPVEQALAPEQAALGQARVLVQVPVVEAVQALAQAARELAQAQMQEVEAPAVAVEAEAEDLAPGSWRASPEPLARCQRRARRARTPAWRGCTSAGC